MRAAVELDSLFLHHFDQYGCPASPLSSCPRLFQHHSIIKAALHILILAPLLHVPTSSNVPWLNSSDLVAVLVWRVTTSDPRLSPDCECYNVREI